MTEPLTPESLAELRRLYSEWQETVNPYGFRLMPSGEYYALVAAAVNALPALLDAAERLAEVEAERDALAAKVERVRALHPRDDDWCPNCGQPHPCDTRRALDGTEGDHA